VTLTRPYLISIHEVTNKQFAEFRRNHDSGADVHASLAADDNPVANVSWEDAVQYCNWLSTQEGRTPAYRQEFDQWVPIYPTPDGYRLPTEAEWVLAIRYAGGKRAMKFPWGDKWPPPKDSGNLADVSARELVPSILPAYDDGYASTAPVGKFKPNAIGIYDTAGNVAEWVNDWYSALYYSVSASLDNPIGPPMGNPAVRVFRGGGFGDPRTGLVIGTLRTSDRFKDEPIVAYQDLGFRCAKAAE